MSQIKFNLGGWMKYIHVLHPTGAPSRVKIRSYAFFLIPPEITIRLVTRWHILVPKLVPAVLGRALN